MNRVTHLVTAAGFVLWPWQAWQQTQKRQLQQQPRQQMAAPHTNIETSSTTMLTVTSPQHVAVGWGLQRCFQRQRQQGLAALKA